MSDEAKAIIAYTCTVAGLEKPGRIWGSLDHCDQRDPDDEKGVVCWGHIETEDDPDDPELSVDQPQPCDALPYLCIPADEAREFLEAVEGIAEHTKIWELRDKARALLATLPEK